MKLLVSPIDAEEVKEAIEGGADIIDIKNPKEGSLGANFPWMIEEVSSLMPGNVELSATLGDLDFKPGTASLAAYGLASLGVDYVKAGLYGIVTENQAKEIAMAIKKSIEGFDSNLVLAGYADFQRINAISPLKLPEIGSEVGAKVVMIDTAVKNGNSLLGHMDVSVLQEFVDLAHDCGLKAALAGSLGLEEIEMLTGIGVDIIGVRGAACSDNDRVNGRISGEKVRRLKVHLEGINRA
ncbi:MAG: (5-formylfuran-3-yl)methyl phosphate synthase [Candidatus Hydrothermarchaeales archaeon]